MKGRNGRKGEKLLVCKKEVVEMAEKMYIKCCLMIEKVKSRYENCNCPWK